MKRIVKKYDVVVVGGGLSGVCAAIASARNGANTALLQNRQVLGGNASSEIRVNINGALRNSASFKKNVGEGGILMEILLANKLRNPQHSFHVLDYTIWEKVQYQEGLDLYLNTSFFYAETENHKILSISALQTTSETMYEFQAKYYIDTTGDACVAYESGAQWTIGREAKSTYNEAHAPEIADCHTMGSTIMFSTKDMGKPVKYVKPEWAHTFTKEKLAKRSISTLGFGYWWTELGGDDLSVIEDAETINEELKKWVFGIFDYIKNSGEYEADNLALDWIASVPGRRESRRIIGDYVLREEDCYEGKRFKDAIAYGGWTMDDHSVGGILAKGAEEEGTRWLPIKDIYTIPYRCIYSKNIENLFVGGRAISVSHMAMTSTRVMATCAIIGQAAGTAAALCKKKKCAPRDLGEDNARLLQQTLLKDDCYIPGITAYDEADLCANGSCHISASSSLINADVSKLTNGYRRDQEEVDNAWCSQPIDEQGAYLELTLDEPKNLSELNVKFDPDFNVVLITTPMKSIREKLPVELPPVLVRDFKIECYLDNQVLYTKTVEENDRCNWNFDLSEIGLCDKIRITMTKTYGDKHVRVYEVRLY